MLFKFGTDIEHEQFFPQTTDFPLSEPGVGAYCVAATQAGQLVATVMSSLLL